MRKLFVVVGVLTVLLLAGGLMLAVESDVHASRYPISFHVPEIATVIPGVPEAISWHGRRDATTAFRRGSRVLLGTGQYGTNADLGEDCRFAAYQRGKARPQDLPGWARSGLSGKMVIVCRDSSEVEQVLTLSVLEIGCLPTTSVGLYATAFNETMLRMIKVEKSGGHQTHNTRMQLTDHRVTPLAEQGTRHGARS